MKNQSPEVYTSINKTNSMKKAYIFSILILMALVVSAQQDPMYTQYWVNPQVLNPAQAGADGRTTLNATARLQWINVKGAPRTYSVALGGMVSNKVGLGLSYVHDQVGISRTNSVNADFAYHLNLTKKWKLITGLRVIGLINNVNFSEINTTVPGDPMFLENTTSGLKPNAGFGFVLTNNKFYLGYTEPRVVNYDFASSKGVGNTKIISHRFMYAGYNFDISHDYKLRPSVLTKQVENAPVQFDINVVNEIRNRLLVGFSARTGEGVGIMVGFINYHKLDVYYCYDYPLTTISLLSKQTHQITLAYNLSTRPQRINSPRYFN